jgi:hypothetical protein
MHKILFLSDTHGKHRLAFSCTRGEEIRFHTLSPSLHKEKSAAIY